MAWLSGEIARGTKVNDFAFAMAEATATYVWGGLNIMPPSISRQEFIDNCFLPFLKVRLHGRLQQGSGLIIPGYEAQ